MTDYFFFFNIQMSIVKEKVLTVFFLYVFVVIGLKNGFLFLIGLSAISCIGKDVFLLVTSANKKKEVKKNTKNVGTTAS